MFFENLEILQLATQFLLTMLAPIILAFVAFKQSLDQLIF
jgi:hypothetical protein